MKFIIKPKDFYIYFEDFGSGSTKFRTPDYMINKPYACYFIKENIYNWFKELDIEYRLYFHYTDIDIGTSFWIIEILDENRAMLFKLTWM
jgi:hypothetical protein